MNTETPITAQDEQARLQLRVKAFKKISKILAQLEPEDRRLVSAAIRILLP